MTQVLQNTAIGLALCLLISQPHAFAAAGLDKDKKTAAVQYDFQLAVHKSNSVSGTDFGDASRITASGHAGKGKQFGFALRTDTVSTSFTQKDAKMAMQFNDAELSYRLFWVSTSVFLGSCEITAKAQNVELIDSICISSGFGLRGEYPLTDAATTAFGLESHTVSEARDRTENRVMIKRRIEADGNISYNLTSYADLIAGLRYRTFLLKIDTDGSNEIQTGPYAGVRVGFNF